MRYTAEPYEVTLFSGETVQKFAIRTPGGHALFNRHGDIHTFKNRSSAHRKARQLNKAYGL